MGDVREIDLEYQGYTLVGLWNLLMCERGQHKKQLTTLQAEKERLEGELGRLRRIVTEIWETFYGQNMSVNNWHMNGDSEPMDSFFENNDWSVEDESAVDTQKTA